MNKATNTAGKLYYCLCGNFLADEPLWCGGCAALLQDRIDESLSLLDELDAEHYPQYYQKLRRILEGK